MHDLVLLNIAVRNELCLMDMSWDMKKYVLAFYDHWLMKFE